MKPPKTYSTNDFYLTSVLCTLGADLEAIEKESDKRAIFVFRYTPDIPPVITAYWKHQLSIEPQALFNAMRMLKARLYN